MVQKGNVRPEQICRMPYTSSCYDNIGTCSCSNIPRQDCCSSAASRAGATLRGMSGLVISFGRVPSLL